MILMDNQFNLYRCTIISETKNYLVGRNVRNNKFFIKKNEVTERYKIGDDISFHASSLIKGFLLKRTVLNPISHDELIKNTIYNTELDSELLSQIKNISKS
jgi:hypothetical protein